MPTKPKNIVLISLDDAVAFWRYKTVFGEELRTPNLDRICAQSTAFHSAYCQYPVCSPSRASFMSGLSPYQSGFTVPNARYFDTLPPERMWPYRLKQAGYFCSSGGKVMAGYGALPPKVHAALFSDARKKFKLERRKRQFKEGIIPNRLAFDGFRGGLATIDEDGDRSLYDHQATQSALDFLRTYDGDAPFYREVGLIGTHGPWTTPRRFKEMYDERKLNKPAAWGDGFAPCPVMDEDSDPNYKIGRLEAWQKSVRNYFSGLSYVDYHVGLIFDAIKSSPHSNNTLIIILSDHGLHLGERNRIRKHTLWEQVANVPLIIHDPDQPTGHIVSDPVSLIDVGPTVLDFLGLPEIEDSPGQSLRSLIDWGRAPDRAIPTFLHGSAAIRKGRYRFIRYRDGTTQFFDLARDWWQTRELGPDHQQFEEMQETLKTCCAAYGLDVEAACTTGG